MKLEDITMVLMSWELPKKDAKINPSLRHVDSFSTFEEQLLTRLDVLTLVDKVSIRPAFGQYSGKKECSAMIMFNDEATLADIFSIIDVTVNLGKDLGQESVLLRHNKENILFNCDNGKVLATGQGMTTCSADNKKHLQDDFTMVEGIKFSLDLTLSIKLRRHMPQINKIETFIEVLTRHIEDTTKKKWPDCPPNHSTISFIRGPKYYKVIKASLEGHNRSVYCFIDNDGNIYKAASWKAPAKGIRAHIDTVKMSEIDEYGSWLYVR